MAENQVDPEVAEFESMLGTSDVSEVEAEKNIEKAKNAGTDFYNSVSKEAQDLDAMFSGMSEPPPPKEGEPPKDSGFFGIDKLKAATSAAGKGFVKATEDFANGVYDLGNAAENFFAEKGMGNGKWLEEGKRFDWVDTPKTPADAIVFQTARFLMPLGAFTKGMSALGLVGKAATGAALVGDAAYTGLTMDPEDKRLSDYLEAVPELAPIIPDILVSKPDDTRLERRLKNAGEALGMGAGFMALGKGIGMLYKGKKTVDVAKEGVSTAKQIGSEVGVGVKSVKDATDELAAKSVAKVVPELTKKEVKMLDKAAKYFQFKADDYTDLQLGYAKGADSLEDVVNAFDLPKDSAFQDIIKEFKGNPVSLDAAKKAAEQRMKDPGYIPALLKKVGKEPIDSTDYVALMGMGEGVAKELQDVIPAGLTFADDAEKMVFEQKFADAVAMTELIEGGISDPARMMRFKQEIWDTKKPVEQIQYINQYAKIVGKDAGEKLTALKLAQSVNKTIPEVVRDVAKKGRLHKVSDVIYESFINGALYNAGTFGVNALGHLQTATMHTLETAVGASLTKMGLIPGSTMSFSEIPAIWKGYAASLAEGFTLAKEVLAKGNVPESYAAKFAVREAALNTAGDIIRAEGMGSLQKGTAKFLDLVGQAMSVPTRGLSAVDAASKLMQSRARLHQYAARQVDAAGLVGDQAKAIYQNIIKNPPEELTAAAQKFSEAQTYTSADYKNLLFGGVGEAAQKIASWVPMGRVFIPFTQVATNIADYTARRTVFSALSPKIRAELAAGGATRAEAIAKMATGSAIMSLGAYMAYNGNLRGTGASYYNQRAILTGDVQDKAMKINGTWVPIEKLAPIATLMLVGADIARLGTYADEDTDMGEVATAAAGMVLGHMTPEYMTGSMADFLDGLAKIEEGKIKVQGIGSAMSSFAETATPFRYVFKNVSDFRDPTRRDVKPEPDLAMFDSAWSEYKNRLMESMGLGKELPPQYNIFGEPIEIPPGFFQSTISPFFKPVDQPDDVIEGLRKLGMDMPNLPFMQDEGEMALRITMPDRVIEKGAAGVMTQYKMSPKEYEKLIKFMNEDDGRGTLKEQVRGILQDSEINDEMKKFQIKEVISTAKSRARQKMMLEEPDIIEKQIDGAAKRRQALVGIGE